MKRLTLEATDKNILNSIKNNTLQRSKDVRDFLMMIDIIDYNAFISVDAAWGEGKTFFVRQAEMTMKYYHKKVFGKTIEEQELEAFQRNNVLGTLELKHTYLPIYFDAWLYDNHMNALMALLMVTIKQGSKFVDTQIENEKGEIISSILDSIQFWKSSNWSDLLEKIKGKNLIEEALLLEEVRLKVKEVFNEILVEDAEKLVIFIDELDRCRPTFAIEMLEGVKHYFDDDRIIFVLSVNKSQLIHTISRYYGDDFDGNLYLNKFFDINIQLPKADTRVYFDVLGISCNDYLWIKKFANELQKYYRLSLRDTTRYFQKIDNIQEKWSNMVGVDSWKVLMLFIPILCALDIVDIAKKQKLLSGKGFDILEELLPNSGEMQKYVLTLTEKSEDNDVNCRAGMEELKRIYEFGFSGDYGMGWYSGRLEIRANLGDLCLRICNNM